jgi:hypothetical protein
MTAGRSDDSDNNSGADAGPDLKPDALQELLDSQLREVEIIVLSNSAIELEVCMQRLESTTMDVISLLNAESVKLLKALETCAGIPGQMEMLESALLATTTSARDQAGMLVKVKVWKNALLESMGAE